MGFQSSLYRRMSFKIIPKLLPIQSMFSSASPPSSIHNAEFQSPETSIFAVNNRRRQHMKLLFLPLTLPHPNPLQSTKISCLYKPPNPKPYPSRIRSSTPPPPRDVVIDFGKHKGKMLGSLPSSYLKWVSKNLRTADFEEWAKLADLVLEDPIYRDRIEWEFADRIMTGKSASFSRSGKGAADELRELSERFGWDFQPDAAGWGKVDFTLLGTSFGGRLPRIDPNRPRDRVEREAPAKRGKASAAAVDGETSGRERRRERMRSKKGERSSAGRSKVARLGNINGENESDDEEADENRAAEVAPPKRFPGRESLWKKVIDREKLL